MELNERAPFSFEAEQSVLGAVIVEPSVIDILIPLLRPEYFYMEQHRRIFEAMLSMYGGRTPIDFVTLLDKVINEGIFSEADGKQYLLTLSQVVPSVENAENYAKIVAEKATLRQLINASDAIKEKSSEGGEGADALVEYAESRIYDIANNKVNTGFYTLSEGLKDSLTRYNDMRGENRDKYIGQPTYFADLDNMLGGMHKGDLIIIAARPGVGKSSLALNVATNVATKAKKKVAFFSLEMSKEELMNRVISSCAMVDNKKLQTGELDDEDWKKVAESANILSECPLYIDDTSTITASQIKAKLRRLRDVGLVVIDYLQLMKTGMRIENRVQEVSEITRSLKLMAKELNVPVISLAQLARKAEERKGERPQLSDLRESGSIEQDADSVLFIYNEFQVTGNPEKQNIMQIIVGKNRHGETGTTELEWMGKYTRFFPIEKRYDT